MHSEGRSCFLMRHFSANWDISLEEVVALNFLKLPFSFSRGTVDNLIVPIPMREKG